MRRPVLWIIVGAVPLVVVMIAAGTAGAVPAVRHIASALWNAPERLPALSENERVHFENGAQEYARKVSALLPAALAKVEAAHGRPFAHPVTVGVYATSQAYAAANPSGVSGAVGVTAFGRVVLSPVLDGAQAWRLRAILTHELSHAHLQGHVSTFAFVRLPNWFKEGLAVMVSEGGGAELVSEREARAAIIRGDTIAIEDSGSFANLSEIRFAHTPEGGTASHRTVMAYRQAAMFVRWLHDSDPPGFARMMNSIFDGRTFVEAIDAGYGRDVQSLWQMFAGDNKA